MANYDNIKLTTEEVVNKLKNQDTFILAITASWCPPCNVMKYGTRDKSSGDGILASRLNDKYFMFEEVLEPKPEKLTEDILNFDLIPLMKAIEECTGIKHREMTYSFEDDNANTTLSPNMERYRPAVPALMTVKNGIVSGFYVYPRIKEHFDLIENSIK